MPNPPKAIPPGKTQMELVQGKMSNQNSIALPLNPPPGTTYYAGTYVDKKSKLNILKCPEGYVFDGSHSLFSSLEDKNVLKYNSAQNWLNLDGTPITTNPWSGGNLTCKRKYCEPMGIVDSDKEYNVIVDDNNNRNHTITCNEGYVFDTTNHRTGKVKCGVIPEMTNDLSKETEVGWIVDNPLLEEQCNKKTNEDECNKVKVNYIISDDINQSYDNTGAGAKHLNCTWVPSIKTNSKGNKSGIARKGECKFIHRADMNKTNPICRSMYCSKKEVSNSDRMDGKIGALPGPNEGSIHGDCVNFDGQILDQITNSSDCACFKHKSCDNCTKDVNCQWCGYSTKPGSKGEGGFCYSRNTPLSICNTSVRSDKGGACLHAKTKNKKPNPPKGGFTKDTCETSVCVNKKYWDNLTSSNLGETKEQISLKYFTDKLTRESCEINNKKWDANALTVAPDHCNLTNKTLNKGNIQDYRYYPHDFNKDNTVMFKISDKICIPNKKNFTKEELNKCGKHISKSTCENDNTCDWINNPLRDSLFNWSRGPILNKITFKGDKNKCPIIPRTDKSTNNEKSFDVQVNGTDGTITLKNASYNLKNNNPITALNDYLTTCPIIKVQPKIFNKDTCEKIMSQGDPAPKHLSSPQNCEGGTKYCSSTTRTKDNSLACPKKSNKITGVNIPPGACHYYPKDPKQKGYGCWGDNVTPNCSIISPGKYNCEKNILPGQQNKCENTGYTPIKDSSSNKSLNVINAYVFNNKRFKNYIKCNVNDKIYLKDRCENIGDKYAHWGNMCVSGKGANKIKLPAKQICELVSEYSNITPKQNRPTGLKEGATWGKFLDSKSFDYGCFKDDGTKYNDAELCNLASVAARNKILVALGGGGIINEQSTFKPEESKHCIIDGATNYNNNYMLSASSASVPTESDLEKICTNSSDHHIAFEYKKNATQGTIKGICKIAGNGPKKGQPTKLDQNNCEENNNLWVPKHYKYNVTNSCDGIGSSQLKKQPDIPTTWTGGEIVNDNGIHRSECSPSIMSSCNVKCDPGYGGGGEYICQYNSSGGDVCETIDRKVIPDKEKLCNSQVACKYKGGKCIHDTNFSNDGHLEWIGSPCYKIDNTAFAHGISKLPDLDVVFPPFERVIFHLLILMAIMVPFIYIFSHYLLKYVGVSVDKSFNTSFKLLNRLIDYFTVDNKLFDLITDKNMTGGEKSGLFISAIVLFIGSYFLFDYIREYIHKAFHTSSGMVGELFTKLGHLNVVVPPKNTNTGDHIKGKLDKASIHARDRIKFVLSGSGTNITEESAKLTMIVQVAVVSLVGLILFMLIIKDPGDLRKKLEARAAKAVSNTTN